MKNYKEYKIEDILGRTIKKIEHNEDEFVMTLENGDVAQLYHIQNCCESVTLADISGDVEDLLHSPLTMATMEENTEAEPESDSYATWTFYKFATINGYVTLRFVGESNGYYSESVDFSINGEWCYEE